MLSKNITKSKN